MTEWPKLTRGQCIDLEVPGGVLPVAPALAPIFADLAAGFHVTVEPLAWPGCWGWDDRNIAGTSIPSKHWRGIAVDLNAPKHPQGVPAAKTFSRAQLAAVSALLARYRGLITWGGLWSMPDTDGMHFELSEGVTFRQVTQLAATLHTPAPAPPTPRPAPAPHRPRPDLTGAGTALRGAEGNTGPRVAELQAWLNRYAPAYSRLEVDGVWGPATSRVVAEFGHRSGITSADGRNIGPRLAAALYRAGFGRRLSAARGRVASHITRNPRR